MLLNKLWLQLDIFVFIVLFLPEIEMKTFDPLRTNFKFTSETQFIMSIPESPSVIHE